MFQGVSRRNRCKLKIQVRKRKVRKKRDESEIRRTTGDKADQTEAGTLSTVGILHELTV